MALLQRRSCQKLLFVLVLRCAAVSAMHPTVQLEPYQNYTGELRCTGLIKLWVREATGTTTDALNVEYHFQDADDRCTSAAALPPGACSFAAYAGTSCAGAIGPPLYAVTWYDPAGRPDAAPEAVASPWSATRYNVSADGVARGKLQNLEIGMSQAELYLHVVLVTDADGVYVSCGRIKTECWTIMGSCFHIWARLITGVAAVLAILDSAWLIQRHMKHNHNPALRKYTCRILLMVPIYSTQAFIALWFQVAPLHAELLRFFRELYEAIVLFSFLEFILTCVGGPAAVVRRFDGRRAAAAADLVVSRSKSGLEAGASEEHGGHPFHNDMPDNGSDSGDSGDGSADDRRKHLQHIFPWYCFFPPWRSAQQMLRWCVAGTLLYIVAGTVVPITALMVDLVTKKQGENRLEDSMEVGKYMIMIASMCAINALFELAHVFLHELKDLNPIAKFASVKLVIFFTFWQGIVLSWLVGLGAFENFIDASHRWFSQEQISQAVQHGLICIEMLGASVVHHFAFPPGDYKIVQRMYPATLKEARQEDFTSKHIRVVDFRDIITTARYGFASPNVRVLDLDAVEEGESSEDDDSSSGDIDEEPDDFTADDEVYGNEVYGSQVAPVEAQSEKRPEA